MKSNEFCAQKTGLTPSSSMSLSALNSTCASSEHNSPHSHAWAPRRQRRPGLQREVQLLGLQGPERATFSCPQGSSASFSIRPMSWYPMDKVAERGLSFSSGLSTGQGQGPACLAWLAPGRTLGGLAGQHSGATEAGSLPVLQAEPIQGRKLQLLQVHWRGRE